MTGFRASETAHGAYGLTLTGLRSDPSSIGLVAVPLREAWPTLEVRVTVGVAARPEEHALDDTRAVILLVDGEYAEVDRRRGLVTFHTTRPLGEPDVVHPYLASPAGVFAQWHGRIAVHAGGVVLDSGALGVLGDKGAGKTTTLLELHRRGYPVVADDMIVVGGGTVFAGPRCLDAHPDAAKQLGAGAGTELVRDGTRIRVVLPPVAPAVPLRGWVVLQDADAVSARPVPIGERLPWLQGQLMMGVRRPDAGLELLTHPMWELRRPRTWSGLRAGVDALLEAVTRTRTGEPAR